MPKTQTDYENIIIYKLCCKNSTINDIYLDGVISSSISKIK